MTFEKTDEKRRFHRFLYYADALLQKDDAQHPCKILDLSLKGCLLDCGQPWPVLPDTLYRLTLNLNEDIAIVMDLTVAHTEGNQIGCKCEHIDIDSISRLRRLVELNLGDSELLERELAALTDCAFQQYSKHQSS